MAPSGTGDGPDAVHPSSRRGVSAGLVLALLLTVSCSENTAPTDLTDLKAPTPWAAEVIHEIVINEEIDYGVWFIECANGGVGEEVHLTGTLSAVLHLTLTGSRFVLHTHGTILTRGVGAVTGDQYHGVDVISGNDSGSLVNGQFTSVGRSSTRIAAPGAGGDLRLSHLRRFTWNANGETKVDFQILGATCG